MAITLTHARSEPQPASDAKSRPLWNPYAAGALLGLVLLATYLVTGRGLGASAAFSAVAAWLAGSIEPAATAANAVHARYWNEGAPLLNWTLFLLAGAAIGAWISGRLGRRTGLRIEHGPRIGDGARLALAFSGGFIAAFGAKIAKGCTSGQALSGGALLNSGSLIFMLAVFGAAYALAYLVRKEWI